MNIKPWMLVVVAAGCVTAIAIAYYLGNQEGIATGAAAAMAVGAKYWKDRGKSAQIIEDAIDSTSTGVEKLDEIFQDTTAQSGYDMNEVASMSGSAKLELLNRITNDKA